MNCLYFPYPVTRSTSRLLGISLLTGGAEDASVTQRCKRCQVDLFVESSHTPPPILVRSVEKERAREELKTFLETLDLSLARDLETVFAWRQVLREVQAKCPECKVVHDEDGALQCFDRLAPQLRNSEKRVAVFHKIMAVVAANIGAINDVHGVKQGLYFSLAQHRSKTAAWVFAALLFGLVIEPTPWRAVGRDTTQACRG